jgi:hypothetical protein
LLKEFARSAVIVAAVATVEPCAANAVGRSDTGEDREASADVEKLFATLLIENELRTL